MDDNLMPYRPFPDIIFLLGFPMIRPEPIYFRFSRVADAEESQAVVRCSSNEKNSKGKALDLKFSLRELISNSSFKLLLKIY